MRPAPAFPVLLAVLLAGCGGSGSRSMSADATLPAAPSTESPSSGPPPKIEVETLRYHLPAPLSGEAVVPRGKELMVIGGLDQSDASVATVTSLDPVSGEAESAGRLSQPLHDLAAAEVSSGVLIFGGGSATTTAEVQRVVPGAAGEAVGELPVPRSDLSAVRVGGAAYVLAGYDGESAIGEILKTRDGSRIETVGKLPVAVRYAAVFALGPIIYAIGGEESSGADTTAIQAFDTRASHASIVGHLIAPLAHASPVVLGGRAYILGGRLNGSTTDQILRFDPAAGTAKRAARLPIPIQNGAAAVVGGVGYLVGGLSREESTLASVVAVRLGPRQ